ncbi:ABC transporter [Paramyrothecium foliicola]|nr:ABC transporter [Paramyrothecium foliicola]
MTLTSLFNLIPSFNMKSQVSLAAQAVLMLGTCAVANCAVAIEKRTLEQIHQAALAEGGVVTLWHGGDEKNQQDGLKQSFEERFPGMTLNVTVDLSKYHDGAIDQQLAAGNVFVDSVILQTLQDYPRWAKEGALLSYAPAGFDKISPAFKDAKRAAWHGVYVLSWDIITNTEKLPNVKISDWPDLLRPELKGKLVLTYPNDDDAILWAFDLIVQEHGVAWLDALIAQNPRWVRGSATPIPFLFSPDAPEAVSFTSILGWQAPPGFTLAKPTQGSFVSWPQTAAILKKAPHPEGAKLLHNWILSEEFQQGRGWSVRNDIPDPEGFPYEPLDQVNNTDPGAFLPWMNDRARVGRLKDWYESKIGTPQGLSPLTDDL